MRLIVFALGFGLLTGSVSPLLTAQGKGSRTTIEALEAVAVRHGPFTTPNGAFPLVDIRADVAADLLGFPGS